MIVDRMQLEEVHQEMMRDYAMVRRKAQVQANLYHKEMLRKNLKQEIRTTTYKTIHNNVWTLVIRNFPDQTHTSFYIETSDKNGKVAYMLEFIEREKIIWLVKYNTHFFKRYRERCQPTIVESSQLLKHFFRHNLDMDQKSGEELEDGTRLLQQVTTEGLCIGWLDKAKKVIHMKTFLPNHMLNKGQQNIVSKIKEYDDAAEFNINVDPKHLKNKF